GNEAISVPFLSRFAEDFPMLQHRRKNPAMSMAGSGRAGLSLMELRAPIIMRRYETRSTMMTSNRPLEDWGKLLGDVPSATAILDRFLHHAEIIQITGKSYRLRQQGRCGKAVSEEPKPATAPLGSAAAVLESKPATAPLGSAAAVLESKPATAPLGSEEGGEG